MNQPEQKAVYALNPMWPFNPKSFPPDVWETARKCAEPRRYLEKWLELEVKTKNLQLVRGSFVLEHWESLRQAGLTPKQLRGEAISGEGFEGLIGEAFIQELVPSKLRATAKKLSDRQVCSASHST